MDVFRIVKFNTLPPIIYHEIDANATQTHLLSFDIYICKYEEANGYPCAFMGINKLS
mgnify:CR=1 FL=1